MSESSESVKSISIRNSLWDIGAVHDIMSLICSTVCTLGRDTVSHPLATFAHAGEEVVVKKSMECYHASRWGLQIISLNFSHTDSQMEIKVSQKRIVWYP
ncbi:hypothetical protein Nepgr_027567 [Nepenthes gracilis]|uniref:Uncharacterized protein n=1 Tax=Nepenthes gracilis TaxID=150966 RepID=A0AAD3Y386_NEPGR|nr:hypothetical protein Nepgr_027567 [Nepenthes gracilis]